MTAITDLIARTAVRHRPTSLLSAGDFLHISREPRGPNPHSPPTTTTAQPTTQPTIQPKTQEDPQSAFAQMLSNKCAQSGANHSATNALSLATKDLKHGPLQTASRHAERQAATAERTVLFEYGRIFGDANKARTLSQIVAKAMPPMKNPYLEAVERMAAASGKLQEAVEEGGECEAVRLRPVDCKLLEYEHLCAILRRLHVAVPKSTAAAVNLVEARMAHTVSSTTTTMVALPKYTPPTISKTMTANQQLFAIVSSLEDRKAEILRHLKEHMRVEYSGPFLKDTLFWDVVRDTISSMVGVCDDVVELVDANNRQLIHRYRLAIIDCYSR